MTAGERLRRARRKQGKRQIDMATELGVTQPRIQQLEASDRVPSHLIRELARVYKVDPLDLLPKKRAA